MARKKVEARQETVRAQVIREILNHQCQFKRKKEPWDDYDYQPDDLPECDVELERGLALALCMELMDIDSELQRYAAPLPNYNRLRSTYLQIDPELCEVKERYAGLIALHSSKTTSAPKKVKKTHNLRLVWSRD